MKTEKKYHGVVVPMVTPFTEQGKVDESAAVKITDHLLEGGAYPFLLGTTGELASIPDETRLKFVKRVVEHVKGRTLVYVGISDNCLERSLNIAQKYHDMGVDVFVAHLPSYYPLTSEHMLKYFETLADRVPNPIMLYNIKVTTNMSIPLDIIEKLSYHPKIIGLKDSERDVDRLKAAAALFSSRSDFSLLCGSSAQSANALLIGFDGIVPSTGNVIPDMFKQLYDAAVKGHQENAHQLQAKVDAVTKIHVKVEIPSQVLAALKAMLYQLGLCEPWVLPPLSRVSPAEEQQIKKEMQELGLTI